MSEQNAYIFLCAQGWPAWWPSMKFQSLFKSALPSSSDLPVTLIPNTTSIVARLAGGTSHCCGILLARLICNRRATDSFSALIFSVVFTGSHSVVEGSLQLKVSQKQTSCQPQTELLARTMVAKTSVTCLTSRAPCSHSSVIMGGTPFVDAMALEELAQDSPVELAPRKSPTGPSTSAPSSLREPKICVLMSADMLGQGWGCNFR
mmetsp:Transcript_31463/g.56444  ORF Transcript_31463/g.56444 Transcript_31463/m.56444 type:complete len:205 (-) Transcript_31463:2179-2793(-)